MRSRYDQVMSLSLRRGFLFPSAEIYGGLAGFYDYGHLGAMMKRKWEDLWTDYFLSLDDNYYLIDTTSILPYKGLKASGHVDHFTDVMLTCSKCGESYKAELLLEDLTEKSVEAMTLEEIRTFISTADVSCPECGGKFADPSQFNMMFPVAIGTAGKDKGFLRPETAQGAYLNFKREYEALRRKLPMGLAIIGRAFRNEISPRQGTYRMREFLQAELQIFFNPKTFEDRIPREETANDVLRIATAEGKRKNQIDEVKVSEIVDEGVLPLFFAHHIALVQRFYHKELGIPTEKLRLAELSEEERAFYNKIHYDIEVDLESLGGWREVAGVHYRSDHDLTGHEKGSNERMSVMDGGERIIPHVLELSFGIDRTLWAMLDILYTVGERTVLRLPPRIAPISVGVFPLVNKAGLPEKAREVYRVLRRSFDAFYDDAGSIGRRYARMDEIGTPFCVTIDHQSLESDDVTVRERDSTDQVRISIDDLRTVLNSLLTGVTKFEELK